jgi:hypothetical protein
MICMDKFSIILSTMLHMLISMMDANGSAELNAKGAVRLKQAHTSLSILSILR